MSNKNVSVRKSQEITFCLLASILMFMAMMVAGRVEVGVVLGAVRVIHPIGQKQVQLAVTNNDENSTCLTQPWVENADGVKDGRFIVTPSLSTMKGKKENILRILDATNNQLPQDRESLFWMNVKAVPLTDKSKLTENALQLAIVSRVKLYYHPAKLVLSSDQAIERLRLRCSANSPTPINPTSCCLTVAELNAGARVLENALVPPIGESMVKLSSDAGSNIIYRIINDYGVLTPKMTGVAE